MESYCLSCVDHNISNFVKVAFDKLLISITKNLISTENIVFKFMTVFTGNICR